MSKKEEKDEQKEEKLTEKEQLKIFYDLERAKWLSRDESRKLTMLSHNPIVGITENVSNNNKAQLKHVFVMSETNSIRLDEAVAEWEDKLDILRTRGLGL